ncbi:MAG: glucose-1-phosphate adenylyltransferase [Candidatus Omnitrophota bacterium]
MKSVLTFILAGGKGERLHPLTKDRVKPAVPFGGIYRIIDFTLSNCINSGLRQIYVLIQYKSISLQRHLAMGWNIFNRELNEFIDAIPAQQRIGSNWYRGTADAIYQNFYSIDMEDPEHVLILAGDHVYKMDYSQMIEFHLKNNADMTVACVPMPKELSNQLGVVEVDKNGKVYGFQEKPQTPKTIIGQPSHIYASMGIYLFKKNILKEELEQDENAESEHDFGKNIIPQMVKKSRDIYVFNFSDEKGTPKYWRDIGTRDAYYEANMDLIKEGCQFDLFERNWPIRTYQEQFPPFKAEYFGEAKNKCVNSIVNCLISTGCVIRGGVARNSVLSPGVYIEDGAEVTGSILMESVKVGKNAKIKNAIIDKDVTISNNTIIGYNPEDDRKRFTATTSGIALVAKKTLI